MINSIIRILDRCIGVVAAIALAASALMILMNVFNRYVVLGWLREAGESSHLLNSVFVLTDGVLSPISATADEIPGLLLVWIAFLGAYLAYRQGGHIAFDLVVEKMPPFFRRTAILFKDGAILTFLILLLVQSLRMIKVDGETEIETAEIAQGWFMSIMPLAAILLIMALILDIVKRWHTARSL